MKKTILIFLAILFVLTVYWVQKKDKNLSETEVFKPETSSPVAVSNGGSTILPQAISEKKLEKPLLFPLEGFNREFILTIPDSRVPGAPRTYRGGRARHKGLDMYTGKCGVPVYAVADGWVILVNNVDNFADAVTRNSFLEVAGKVGFTPEPLLESLHGISLAIFHGWDENGNYCYSRFSHFDKLDANFKVGDYVQRGRVIGYVGATGTSAQFKSEGEKQIGCHLHFEWHECASGEDKPLGFEDRDNDTKRKKYYDLFSPDEN